MQPPSPTAIEAATNPWLNRANEERQSVSDRDGVKEPRRRIR